MGRPLSQEGQRTSGALLCPGPNGRERRRDPGLKLHVAKMSPQREDETKAEERGCEEPASFCESSSLSCG